MNDLCYRRCVSDSGALEIYSALCAWRRKKYRLASFLGVRLELQRRQLPLTWSNVAFFKAE